MGHYFILVGHPNRDTLKIKRGYFHDKNGHFDDKTWHFHHEALGTCTPKASWFPGNGGFVGML